MEGDILEFPGTADYDMVILNFFLNMFKSDMVDTFLTHIISMCKPTGGRVVVGDWSKPKGYNPIKRIVTNANWWGAVGTYRLIGSVDHVHPIYDYPKLCNDKGLTVEKRKFFRLLGVQTYECLITRTSQ